MQSLPDDEDILTRLRKPTEQFFTVLSILSAPLMVAFLAALFLWIPEQTREIYRVYGRDLALVYGGDLANDRLVLVLGTLGTATGAGFGQIECGLLGLVLASVFNWQLARTLSLKCAQASIGDANMRGVALRWLPRICGALIPAGAGNGLLVASREIKAIPFEVTASASVPKQDEASLILAIVGVLLLAFCVVLVVGTFLRTFGKPHKYASSRNWLFSKPVLAVSVVVTLASVLLFSAPLLGETSVLIAQVLGTPAIFFWFMIQLSYYASFLSAVHLRYGVPVLPILAAYVLGIAWSDINDNHFVALERSPAPGAQPTPPQPLLSEAFGKWYEAREDRAAYTKAGKPYPVFLVSAAGGGLYAAEFAATALARLQDGCPGFAQHTFAISAVSGGGLGSSLFSTLVANEKQVKAPDMTGLDPCDIGKAKPEAGNLELRTRDYLRGDFLAPIAAAGLFPDFLQRFLPFPLAFLDRSRAFEASLDARWKNMNKEPLAK